VGCKCVLLVCAVLQSNAAAQVVFSIDFQGPTIGQSDAAYATAITEGDLLTAAPAGVPGAPSPSPPRIVVFAGQPHAGPLGIDLKLSGYGAAVGHAPGEAGGIEVDALSFGTDFLLTPDVPFTGVWVFSVDEFADGAAHGIESPPNLTTEGANGSLEASADVFVGHGISLPGPLPFSGSPIPPPGNAVLIDGNGVSPPGTPHPSLAPFIYGLGLAEPNPPTSPPGPPDCLPDAGDNIDALDVDGSFPPGSVSFPIYFSLDSAFADSLESPPPAGLGPVNSGSATAHGFSGADVLVIYAPGDPPVVYASANQLGLDLVDLGGPDIDDVDALIVRENGIPGYQPAQALYDWGPGRGDMILFSVRRGSRVIGETDSLQNAPIEAGDILVPPFGGPAFPGVFIAAETLGLGTWRTGAVRPDDLDALDVSPDCNGNGVPDRLDAAWGLADDCDENGVPDQCETLPLSEIPGSTCADERDNDCDGATDCLDSDCAPDAGCPCGNGSCNDPGENVCTCPEDCGPPDDVESPGATCDDGFDNDCDGSADCQDGDCATDAGCLPCGNGVCGDAGEDACSCPDDCGPPDASEIPGETCADGIDNDCSGSADCQDSACAADPDCLCGNGVCGDPGEDPCTCPEDCGPPPEPCPAMPSWALGIIFLGIIGTASILLPRASPQPSRPPSPYAHR
jgi:hypothetical protein